MIIYIDIETIPTTNQSVIDSIRNSISAPANYTKPETIQKWLDENGEQAFQEKYRKTALDGLYGEIISISWAIEDDPVDVLYRPLVCRAETDLLKSFMSSLPTVTGKYGQRGAITKWVGHYVTGFDLRFIWQRCIINKVKPTVRVPYNAKPWGNVVFDTKIEWTGVSHYSGAGTLDALSQVMLGEGKGEINGSNVYDYWLRGEYEKIAEYNKDDVERCRKLYKLMNFEYELGEKLGYEEPTEEELREEYLLAN